MLKEQNLLEMKLRKEQAVRDLAQSILLYRPEDENEGSLLLHGRELGYNLERCRVAVILDILSHTGGEEWVQKVALQQIRAFFQDPSHLISPLDNFRIALFPALRCGDEDGGMEDAAAALCRSLLDTLKESGIVAAAAVGTGATNLRELAESARSAREALRVGKIFKEENLHSARMLETERLLASVSRRRRTKHIAQVLLNLEKHDPGGELAKTFMTWCEASLSPKEVAEKLSIHRNTLQYRLKKIKEKTKLDPWNFHDSFVLWTALVLKMLENNGAFPEEG